VSRVQWGPLSLTTGQQRSLDELGLKRILTDQSLKHTKTNEHS